MLSEKDIEALLKQKINNDEGCGNATGGSGHLSYISCVLDSFDAKALNDNETEVIFQYTTIIETEFTYYPDNPPIENRTKKRIVLDNQKQIICEESIVPEIDDNQLWGEEQEKIKDYLFYILTRIEWHYGDNRAPFFFPPKFEFVDDPINAEYICYIKGDEGFGDDEVFKFTSRKPECLLDTIKQELPTYINLDFLNDVE